MEDGKEREIFFLILYLLYIFFIFNIYFFFFKIKDSMSLETNTDFLGSDCSGMCDTYS